MSPSNTNRGTLGVLWIIYGVACFLKAIFVVLNSATLTLMWGALLNRVANPFFWMNLFHLALIAGVVLAVIAGIIALLAGMALMGRSQSGRTLGLVAAFLGFLTGPLGVALGVFTVVILLPENGE
jgi:hypothetical protein